MNLVPCKERIHHFIKCQQFLVTWLLLDRTCPYLGSSIFFVVVQLVATMCHQSFETMSFAQFVGHRYFFSSYMHLSILDIPCCLVFACLFRSLLNWLAVEGFHLGLAWQGWWLQLDVWDGLPSLILTHWGIIQSKLTWRGSKPNISLFVMSLYRKCCVVSRDGENTAIESFLCLDYQYLSLWW